MCFDGYSDFVNMVKINGMLFLIYRTVLGKFFFYFTVMIKTFGHFQWFS